MLVSFLAHQFCLVLNVNIEDGQTIFQHYFHYTLLSLILHFRAYLLCGLKSLSERQIHKCISRTEWDLSLRTEMSISLSQILRPAPSPPPEFCTPLSTPRWNYSEGHYSNAYYFQRPQLRFKFPTNLTTPVLPTKLQIDVC